MVGAVGWPVYKSYFRAGGMGWVALLLIPLLNLPPGVSKPRFAPAHGPGDRRGGQRAQGPLALVAGSPAIDLYAIPLPLV